MRTLVKNPLCTAPKENTSWLSWFRHPKHFRSIPQGCFGLWCNLQHLPKSREGDGYHQKHPPVQTSHPASGSNSELFFWSGFQAKDCDPSAMGWSLLGWCKAFASMEKHTSHIIHIFVLGYLQIGKTKFQNLRNIMPRYLDTWSQPSTPYSQRGTSVQQIGALVWVGQCYQHPYMVDWYWIGGHQFFIPSCSNKNTYISWLTKNCQCKCVLFSRVLGDQSPYHPSCETSHAWCCSGVDHQHQPQTEMRPGPSFHGPEIQTPVRCGGNICIRMQ